MIQYLGTVVVDRDGKPRIARPRMTPPPARVDHAVAVPPAVLRTIRGGRGFLARVFGDSMQPTILDYDVAVVVHRAPKDRDIVLVRTNKPHPVYGTIAAVVWRYRKHGAVLTKDNTLYRTQRPVTPSEIMGVVTRVLPRERRNELEHYERIQEIIALEHAVGRCRNPHLGFHTKHMRELLEQIVTIPPSELAGDRLPWGYFRALAKADHPHAGIRAGDTLTINTSPDVRVGEVVIEHHHDGQFLIGVLQRERLHEDLPGEFYIDTAKERIYLTEHDGTPISSTIGVIAHHERLA